MKGNDFGWIWSRGSVNIAKSMDCRCTIFIDSAISTPPPTMLHDFLRELGLLQNYTEFLQDLQNLGEEGGLLRRLHRSQLCDTIFCITLFKNIIFPLLFN